MGLLPKLPHPCNSRQLQKLAKIRRNSGHICPFRQSPLARYSGPMRRYFVADLNARGEVRAVEEYHYEQLEQIPGAGDLIVHFATLLWRTPEEFETPLPQGRSHLTFRW